jgi:hypothetical protein
VVASGRIDSIAGPTLLRTLGVTDPIARGLALGTNSHDQGTAVALLDRESAGAMGGVGGDRTARRACTTPAAWTVREVKRFKLAAKASEAKANLKAFCTTQRAYYAERDTYVADLLKLGFRPERKNRVAYFLARRVPPCGPRIWRRLRRRSSRPTSSSPATPTARTPRVATVRSAVPPPRPAARSPRGRTPRAG